MGCQLVIEDETRLFWAVISKRSKRRFYKYFFNNFYKLEHRTIHFIYIG
jgi:hypothetical protein